MHSILIAHRDVGFAEHLAALLRASGTVLIPAFLPELSGKPSESGPAAPAVAGFDLQTFIRRQLGPEASDLYADTHRMVDRVRVVNAGSVGMTYGEPGAYWAMLGPGAKMRRTEYDRSAAAERIRAKDWSGADEFARKNVITVPSIGEAMDFMRKVEAKQAGA